MKCITCRVLIQDISHYESELHNINIKRKLHEMPIINPEEFSKIQLNKKLPQLVEEKLFSCDFCGKFFKKIKPLENHINSHFNELEDNNNVDKQHNINTNIFTDGVNLFLENSKILAPKKSLKPMSVDKLNGDNRLMKRDYTMPFETPKCIDQFPIIDKVNNKLDKAKYIVRRFD